MAEPGRWVAGILVAILIVALLLVARGERQREVPVDSTTGARIERIA